MKTLPIIILNLAGAPMVALCASSDVAPENPASPAAPAVVASRFIDGDLDTHVLGLRSRIAINQQGRQRGPFGLYQVPGRAPIMDSENQAVAAKTPFSDFVREIPITIVSEKDQQFFVGARVFRLGQVFPLDRGGERISVRVESIKRSSVTFRDLKSKEVASKDFGDRPKGITVDRTKDEPLEVPPGITREDKSGAQPLILDSKTPPATP